MHSVLSPLSFTSLSLIHPMVVPTIDLPSSLHTSNDTHDCVEVVEFS
jgi:hypothetical protein